MLVSGYAMTIMIILDKARARAKAGAKARGIG